VLTKTSPREYKTNIKRQNIKLILLWISFWNG
jgi:hypothetical protein